MAIDNATDAVVEVTVDTADAVMNTSRGIFNNVVNAAYANKETIAVVAVTAAATYGLIKWGIPWAFKQTKKMGKSHHQVKKETVTTEETIIEDKE